MLLSEYFELKSFFIDIDVLVSAILGKSFELLAMSCETLGRKFFQLLQ